MANFCVNCGNKLAENMKFCSNCGVQIGTVSTQGNVLENTKPKSKIIAGLLGIFLGWIGVHNFYLGYTAKGVGQILLTVLSFGILSGLSSIWGMIEGIMILTNTITLDAKGNKLID